MLRVFPAQMTLGLQRKEAWQAFCDDGCNLLTSLQITGINSAGSIESRLVAVASDIAWLQRSRW